MSGSSCVVVTTIHVRLPHSANEVCFLEVQFLGKFILLDVSGKILLNGTVC